MLTPLKGKKDTKSCASLHICVLCFQDCIEYMAPADTAAHLIPHWDSPSLTDIYIPVIYLNDFIMLKFVNICRSARPFPGLGDGHRNWPKSPFLARVISVQSIASKWHFWAFFTKLGHYFGFHCFFFHCQNLANFF